MKSFQQELRRGGIAIQAAKTDPKLFVHLDAPNGPHEIRFTYVRLKGKTVTAMVIFAAQPPEDGKPYFAVGYAVPKRFQKQGRAKDILVAALADNADAVLFVKAGVAEGFLFSGRNLVDHEYRNVCYRYFVNLNGQLVFSGQDNGPPDPMFEVGDVYPGGVRNGKHFDITDVITGEVARVNGCGVMIVGKERDVSKAN